MASFVLSESERQEFTRLRRRVRASRRATSVPLLTFGLVTLASATYLEVVRYLPVPHPLYWPITSLVTLLLLWGLDRRRAVRTGVGEGPRSVARMAAALAAGSVVVAAVAVSGSLLNPFLQILCWPTSVLLAVAVRQRNRTLTAWSGGVAALVLLGWTVDLFIPSVTTWPAPLAAGALLLVAGGLVQRADERSVE